MASPMLVAPVPALEKTDTVQNITAVHLLKNLSHRNFQLLVDLFTRPCLTNIRYSEIKTLVGRASGQLPGSIENISGSHRKLTIYQTDGYFDKIATDAELDTAVIAKTKEITGPLFEAHGKSHRSKLPPIVIRMICSTLERAGITRELLQQSLEVSDEAELEQHKAKTALKG